jgi:exopolysaccharide biosynthesis protein
MEFARQNKVQIAINGSGFSPWYDYKLIYYPHSGEKVTPIGTVVSNKFSFIVDDEQKAPMLMFNGKRPVDISYILGKAAYAIAGTRMLVSDGQVEPGLNNFTADPRTAAGVDSTGQKLILVVVDGRQAGYSKGATLQELAQILIEHGADKALELDGGGSSTLVLNRRDSAPLLLNSPIHQGIPGRERPVATHIGIFVK